MSATLSSRDDLRRSAAQLLAAGRDAAQVCHRLALPPATLRRWLCQASFRALVERARRNV